MIKIQLNSTYVKISYREYPFPSLLFAENSNQKALTYEPFFFIWEKEKRKQRIALAESETLAFYVQENNFLQTTILEPRYANVNPPIGT